MSGPGPHNTIGRVRGRNKSDLGRLEALGTTARLLGLLIGTAPGAGSESWDGTAVEGVINARC